MLSLQSLKQSQIFGIFFFFSSLLFLAWAASGLTDYTPQSSPDAGLQTACLAFEQTGEKSACTLDSVNSKTMFKNN